MDDISNSEQDETVDSLTFFRNQRHELGAITQAVVTSPAHRDGVSTLVLRDENGRRMLLSDCAVGSPDSSRQTAMQVLVEAGFAANIADVVLTHAVVRLGRSCDGTTWLERATNPCVGPPTNRDAARVTRAMGRVRR
jgi:hypothetical protein